MLERFTRQDGDFKIIHIPWLLFWAKGPRGGHARIFSPRQGVGLLVWTFNKNDHYGYSNIRAWIIPGIVALRHNDDKGGTLKHVEPAGWSVRWVRLHFPKISRGVGVQIIAPNHYTT